MYIVLVLSLQHPMPEGLWSHFENSKKVWVVALRIQFVFRVVSHLVDNLQALQLDRDHATAFLPWLYLHAYARLLTGLFSGHEFSLLLMVSLFWHWIALYADTKHKLRNCGKDKQLIINIVCGLMP